VSLSASRKASPSGKNDEKSSDQEVGAFVEAEDLEALQSLFSKYCDSDGLMTKEAVSQIPAITELTVSIGLSSCL